MIHCRKFLAAIAALLATSVSAAAADAAKDGTKPLPKPAATALVSGQVAQAAVKRPMVLPAGARRSTVIIHGIQY